MRYIIFALSLSLVSTALIVSAQDITEPYNFSNLTVQGTARSMGFGNALGSVGGDFSSLSVNPAGIGVYRTSEFTFTPSLRINSASSNYISTTSTASNTHFNINNFGLVFTNAPGGERYEKRNWKTASIAFGMNRVADFNHDYLYQGKNNQSSGSLVFESDANRYPNDVLNTPNTLGYIGYNSYLLNQDGNGRYVSIVPFQGGVNQMKSMHETGGINEYTLSFGGNYKEKLLLGITLGIPSVNYHSNSYYQETISADNRGSNPYGFNSFNYTQALDITGGGINAKLGAIYKFSDIFRIGFAFHTPTYYWLHDVYTPGITTSHNDSIIVLSVNDLLVQNQFDYHLTTPWRGVLSATIILNGMGFITADYEYVDYSSMRFIYPGLDALGNSYQAEQDLMNQNISKTYQGASNFRLGGEIRASKNFLGRIGFGYYGNAYTPYGESTLLNYTTQRIDLSAGIGFHFNKFFTDVAVVHSMYQGFEQPYQVDYNGVVSGPTATTPTSKTDFSINNVALTLGFKL
jgi:hypothetical protein